MASSWTHAAGAVAIAATLMPRGVPPRTWYLVAVAAVVPDLDAIGRLWGGGDVEWLGGHRAFTHSLSFAAGGGLLVALSLRPAITGAWATLHAWVAATLAITTHGALDALTTYGEGIQFLAPTSEQRYWAPWRLLGGGMFRDSIAFVLFYAAARVMITRRNLPLPSALKPQFLRAAG